MNRAYRALKQISILLIIGCLTLIFGCNSAPKAPTAQAMINSTADPATLLGVAQFMELKMGFKFRLA